MDWQPVPKIAAAITAAIGVLVVALFATFVGVDVIESAQGAVMVIFAALAPVVAGYMKADT